MRIVGGTFRGRPLEAPRGRDTRPTTDRMRESIASMILSAQGLDLSECDVLDAFAGSGAMGIELLSRGARSCVFCERDRRAANVVRANCASVGLTRDSFRVVCTDSLRLASSAVLAQEQFSVVFLDPPYAMEAEVVSRLLCELREHGHLGHGCLVIYERASDHPQIAIPSMRMLRSKTHVTTSIDLLRMEA